MATGSDRTLLEFLMDGVSVMALLAMLALIGLQSVRVAGRMADVRVERQLAQLRIELASVAERQLVHYLDEAEFAASAEDLQFVGSAGVDIAIETVPDGWSATAFHDGLAAGQGCAVFFGAGPIPTDPVQPSIPGTVACTE